MKKTEYLYDKMKRNLKEQIERIHNIVYGNQFTLKEEATNKLINNLPRVDDPTKADLVTTDVDDFYNSLEDAIQSGGLTQEKRGSYTYQKNVESMQIGLMFLGYDLPVHGVDGKFGPETAAAVNKFESENMSDTALNEVTLDSPVGPTTLSSRFGPRWGRQHRGVDMRAPKGTKIQAPLDGDVIVAAFNSDDCGGTIKLKHGDGLETIYCHLSKIDVSVGEQIKKGEVIGLTGGVVGEMGAGNSQGPHLHFGIKQDGNWVDPMDFLGSEVDIQGSVLGSSEVLKEATPKMLEKLVELVKSKGIKSEDIKQYIDPLKKVRSLSGLAASNFDEMVSLIINKIEGGYYHPDMLKDGRINDRRYGGSGETMFGLDRTAGGSLNSTAEGQEFWRIVDEANKIRKWDWNYFGGPNESKLRKLVTEIIKNQFLKLSSRFSEDANTIVNSSPKLMFNFIYATFNGPGFFYEYADYLNDLVESGIQDPEVLSDKLVDLRVNSNKSLISQSGRKIKDILNNSIS